MPACSASVLSDPKYDTQMTSPSLRISNLTSDGVKRPQNFEQPIQPKNGLMKTGAQKDSAT